MSGVPCNCEHGGAHSALSTSNSKEGTLDYVCFPKPTSFHYFTERYYNQYLLEDCKGVPGNHCRLLQHSNGLCVLCLDTSHAAVVAAGDPTKDIKVMSITFGSGRNNSKVNPESIKVTGKRKKNALICQKDTKIATVTLTDGTSYGIPACIDGFVLELNAALLEQPWLVSAAPTVEGFIAIINPSLKANISTFKKSWVATGGDANVDEDE